jgi:hypothetical protein
MAILETLPQPLLTDFLGVRVPALEPACRRRAAWSRSAGDAATLPAAARATLPFRLPSPPASSVSFTSSTAIESACEKF